MPKFRMFETEQSLRNLKFLEFEFVSDFDIRISDLVIQSFTEISGALKEFT
jgi:hypothetical protein